MQKTWPARHIGIGIARAPRDVYAFAANPENLPRWASGLSGSIQRSGDAWIAESPMGRITIRMAPRNEFGVLDHDVTLANGETFHNPMRVLANAEGSEVVFALYRREGVSDTDFEADAKTIEKDLRTLKHVLEA